MDAKKNLIFVCCSALLLLTTVAIYWPGLTGGFKLDDFHNIVENPSFQKSEWSLSDFIAAATSHSAGPFGRPVANLTFALDAWAHGLNPYYMKLVNIALHVVVGLFVFLVSRRVISAVYVVRTDLTVLWLPLIASAIWLLHPIHSSTVLYVVQRMAILSALFGMASIFAYILARQSASRLSVVGWLAVHVVLVILAALSKENGLLVLPIIIVIEICIFKFRRKPEYGSFLVRCYQALNVTACLLALGFLVWKFADFTGSYAFRDFTLHERILTQFRMISHYVSLLVYPVPGRFSLYKDGFDLSYSLLEPISTLFAVGGVAAAVSLVLFRAASGVTLIGFAVLWFFVAHAFESTIFPLEIAFEHRNYFPVIGAAIAIPVLFAKVASGNVSERLQIVLMGLMCMVLAGSTLVVSTFWSHPLQHALISAELQPQSARAQYAAGSVYAGIVREQERVNSRDSLEKYVLAAKKAERYLLRAADLSPNAIAPLVQLIILYGDVEESVGILDRVERRLATRALRPAAGNELYRLLECQRQGRCALPDDRLRKAFIAATENPKASKRVKVTCHLLISSLLAVEIGDVQAAKVHIEQAERLLPNSEWVRREVNKFYESNR